MTTLGNLIETKDQTKEREEKEMNEKQKEFLNEYGQSENNNFYIVDSIGVPHPYMIGAKHIKHAADHFSGLLGKEAIESGEKIGITCEMPGCNLTHAEHGQALLVACKEEISINNKANPELHKWMLTIKDKIELEKKYVGFSFIREADYNPE